jgi:hypothetical protein
VSGLQQQPGERGREPGFGLLKAPTGALGELLPGGRQQHHREHRAGPLGRHAGGQGTELGQPQGGLAGGQGTELGQPQGGLAGGQGTELGQPQGGLAGAPVVPPCPLGYDRGGVRFGGCGGRQHPDDVAAAATSAAVALFNPIRQRVQRRVDRRFNRAGYDGEAAVPAFAARLKDAVDLDTVRDDLAVTVQAALEPAHLRIWTSVRDPAEPSSQLRP